MDHKNNSTQLPNTWKTVEDVNGVLHLIDCGIILNWREMKRIRKAIKAEDHERVLQHFAERLAERVDNRLSEEILVESLLVWLAQCVEENQLNAFINALIAQPNYAQAANTLVELAITTEISDAAHADDIFGMAVALICELGLLIHQAEEDKPGAFEDADKIMAHISTYLLSVSNSSNICIRLSLLNYFGTIEQGVASKMGFNRVMGRFGHTVLEHLFSLLFNKKTEAVALQYLLENIPYVLAADNHCQKILHETLKYYMLKVPDRFALFIQTFTNALNELDYTDGSLARRVFLQHLGVLLRVASDVNHKILGRELMCAMVSFRAEPSFEEMMRSIRDEKTLRDAFKDLLFKLAQAKNTDQVVDSAASFRTSKRGRKPSFAKSTLGTLHQVTILGQHQPIARAS